MVYNKQDDKDEEARIDPIQSFSRPESTLQKKVVSLTSKEMLKIMKNKYKQDSSRASQKSNLTSED